MANFFEPFIDQVKSLVGIPTSLEIKRNALIEEQTAKKEKALAEAATLKKETALAGLPYGGSGVGAFGASNSNALLQTNKTKKSILGSF